MDSSNSIESLAFVNANQPEQSKTITYMDLDSYNAAAEGKIEVFKNITNQSLDHLLTPNKNTVLHIYITTLNPRSKLTNTVENILNRAVKFGSKSTTLDAGSELRTTFVESRLNTALNSISKSTTLDAGSESRTNFVEEILIMCPTLLRQANAKGETPLHIAARYGHDDIVDVLIKYCTPTLHQDIEDGIEPINEMLKMTNKEKDTALHEAVRYNHLKVVELLIREDLNFSYSANNAGETPLYIAAERGFEGVLFEILDKCKSPRYEGPLGRTALHAVIIRSDIQRSGHYFVSRLGFLWYFVMKLGRLQNEAAFRTTKRILEKIEGISRKVDNNGWTTLHLAAYFNCINLTKLLLWKDREVAYMKDTMGRTALHIAAQRGNYFIMESIISRCPDCCELVDNRGWNVLHFATKGQLPSKRLEIIVKKLCFSNLLNEKNAKGDTPLHCYSDSIQLAKNFIRHPRVDTMAFNIENLSAYDIALPTNQSHPTWGRLKVMKAWKGGHLPPQRVIPYKDDAPELESADQISMLREAAQAHLVVAALIATVTFAACITMPGGFEGGGEGSHPGSALLRRNAAFKAFVILDTIAMVLSSVAVFIHRVIPFFSQKGHDPTTKWRFLFVAHFLVLGAMLAMGLAFVTGTYAVLEPSLGLAIANCIVGLIIFVLLIFWISLTM